jgi:hypothetical protein
MKQAATIERVALYTRVFTKDGRQDAENQLIQLREYCRKQGQEIAGEHVDHEPAEQQGSHNSSVSSSMPTGASSTWCGSGVWTDYAAKACSQPFSISRRWPRRV